MNSDQARFILRAFRPHVDRQDAPEFAEAFAQLRQDPQLAQWFDQEMAADAAIRGKLSEAVVFPSDLEAQIAASHKVVHPMPRSWLRRPIWLALAASVVVLLTFGILNRGQDRNRTEAFAAFRESVVSASQVMPHVTFLDSDPSQIRAYLKSEKAPNDLTLPPGLSRATLKGCRVLEWNGHKVSVVCLHLRDAGHIDLLVIEHANWDPSGPGNEPLLAQVGSMHTASWSINGRTYVVAAKSGAHDLKRLLSV
jgi:hypothetical protein